MAVDKIGSKVLFLDPVDHRVLVSLDMPRDPTRSPSRPITGTAYVSISATVCLAATQSPDT